MHRRAMRLRDLVGKDLDEAVELVGFSHPERLVHIDTAKGVALDPLAQQAQTKRKRSPALSGSEHLRDPAGVEDPWALQWHAVTALRPHLAAHGAELERVDILDCGCAGEHGNRVRDLAERE